MKKAQKILLFLTVTLFGEVLNAQSTDFIFYDQLKNINNPAAVGEEKGHTISLNLRSQWIQSLNADAPQVQTLNTIHRVTNCIGLAGSVVSDKVFLQRQTAFFADFSYSLPLTESSTIYLGLKAGGNLYYLDGTRFKTYNKEYDPYLQGISGKFQPNVGVGVYYTRPQFYIGVSAPNLLASDKTKLVEDRVTTVSERMLLYSTGGYYFPLTDDFTVKPSYLFYVSKGSQYQLSATASVIYRDFLEAGATYRTTQAANGYILFNIPKFYLSVGYGFESTLQLKASASIRNIHEFMVKFNW
ncbi:PorP/SprF family type IX secretion system membrane protein [Capnocytophaga gingivalis]|jgi:bacteroidetes-specific putative membrane protein|uniref:PorP/SprF family type IX secretion system membrane protein n=1 Tax=Capnocytophaga gingivalis TaxID=1017 RepID=UPI003C6F3BCE